MRVAETHAAAQAKEERSGMVCFRCCQARLLLLAALSGEHILFIGPPGTAKSELGRRLSQLYKGNFFERLLTRFSVPEVSMPLNHVVRVSQCATLAPHTCCECSC